MDTIKDRNGMDLKEAEDILICVGFPRGKWDATNDK